MKSLYDVVFIGGGIVGLASARELSRRFPKLRLALVEKENRLSAHQTGHNSGVIHAGIYYAPGSLKAKLCVEGLHMTYAYCDEQKIPYKKVGKLIVAVKKEELGRLDDLHERAKLNNVPGLAMVEAKEIREIEPHCIGLRGLHSPNTGIVDWSLVADYFAQDFKRSGGEIFLNYKVDKFVSSNPEYPVGVLSKDGQKIDAHYAIACAGLQADLLAAKSGCSRSPRIVPFRGEYLKIVPEKEHLVKGNIYPVPDPKFPFLGVHFTPRMDGSVWLGPNAILAGKREGYGMFDFNLKEFVDALSYPGFQKLALRNLAFGVQEMYKSFNLRAQVEQLRQYVPGLERKDVVRGPSGVRAQALDEQGKLVDDFIFDHGKGELGQRVMHVRNAPSPAATSSMAIAKKVIDHAQKEFGLNLTKFRVQYRRHEKNSDGHCEIATVSESYVLCVP